MPLEEYRRKRDFATTPEPSGEARQHTAPPEAPPRIFVVQEHAASRLHFDFRLEFGGVLLSWAVPKGPSLDPHEKRLAVHVEDHPLDYASFEGRIPEGEYGAGTVIVWDRGIWEPLGMAAADTQAAIVKGDFKFELHGDKLRGAWVLVRMKPRANERAENWLLIKERDDEARPASEYDIVKARPESAASGRTIEQVAEETAREVAPAKDTRRIGAPSAGAFRPPAQRPRDRDAAGNGPMPIDAPMQLAALVAEAPKGDEWIHEVKYDGYRLRAAIDTNNGGRTVRLLTRSGQDWSERLKPLTDALLELPAQSALLDGELVAFDSNGVSDFGALQEALSADQIGRLVYVAFDLLYMDGHDLRRAPLVQRKDLLHSLLSGMPENGVVRFADHVRGSGPEFKRQACTLALEGSVSKLAERPWVAGRTPDWRKAKCSKRQEFVVGGFTEPAGSRRGFGALLLGVFDAEGALHYSGRVGTGFSASELARLRARLDGLVVRSSPFADAPRLSGHTVHWVRPELVAEVAFREWTREGLLRQPSFEGLREDKPATEIRREIPQPVESDTTPQHSSAAGSGFTASKAGRSKARRAAYGRPVEVSGVSISNPEKRLFPQSELTKLELARYYEKIARVMLPHAAYRPLTLVRCPSGSGQDCFYQKHPDDSIAPSLRTIELKEKDGTGTYMYLEDVSGLLALAQMGALEIHTWGSGTDDPERPDRLIFDLDPGPGVEWSQIVNTALRVRKKLESLDFTPFVKTTGGKGLHVVVPVEPSLTYAEARAWTKSFVDTLVAEDPDRLTGKMAKHIRPGRVFVDYVRNSHGATAVAPYSTRARAGAPVAVPIEWDELTPELDPSAFDTKTVLARMERLEWRDPWTAINEAQASSRTLQAAASAKS